MIAPRPESGSQRLLPSGGAVPVLLDSHLDRHGPLPRGAELAATLRDAGLHTRDGEQRAVDLDAADPAEPLVATTAAAKDRALLWLVPHLVLDGLQLVARARGQRRCYLEADGEGPLRTMLDAELAAREDVTEVTLVAAESRAGRRARVGRGLDAETLAHVALIARYGARWFRSIGSGDRPGTALREVRQPNGLVDVVEVPSGRTAGHLMRV